jgi:hypothetical protein
VQVNREEITHEESLSFYGNRWQSSQVVLRPTGSGLSHYLQCMQGLGLQWVEAFVGCPISKLGDHQLQCRHGMMSEVPMQCHSQLHDDCLVEPQAYKEHERLI